jgi:hypothetical protein
VKAARTGAPHQKIGRAAVRKFKNIAVGAKNLPKTEITMSYDPFKPPTPQTKPRPNEPLWQVQARNKSFSCELRYHGEFGVEAMILEDGVMFVGRRFDTRQLAVNWAELERADIEKGGE